MTKQVDSSPAQGVLADRQSEEGQPRRAGQEDQGARSAARRNTVPRRRCREAHVLHSSGTVELREGNQAVGKITGGTEDARNPLSPKLPRRHTAIAITPVEYITIDSDLLDVMLTWDQTGSYEVVGAARRDRRQRRLDDDAAADEGVPQDSAGQHPSDFHAPAASQLQGRRRRHQARRRRRLLLRHHARQVRRHARDAAQQGRHSPGGAAGRRHVRRGSADLGSEAQRDRRDGNRRLADAARARTTSASY